eukprot:542789-Hanusia_phi.AAC.7
MTLPDRGSRQGTEGSDRHLLDSLAQEECHSSGTSEYFRNVAALLRPGGFLLLKSCNHSIDEIQNPNSSSYGLTL